MDTFGTFTFKYEYADGMHFIIRGLTLGEYMDVLQEGIIDRLRYPPSFFIKLVMTCTVGWTGFYDEVGEEIPFTSDTFEYFEDDEFLVAMGRFIWEELSQISEEDVEKIKGHIRYIHYVSDDDLKLKQNFDCIDCVTRELNTARNCTYSTDKINALREAAGLEAAKATRNLRNKRKRGRNRRAQIDGPKVSLMLYGFKFPHCPVSWVSTYLKEMSNICYFGVKNGYLLGSDLTQIPHKVYQIYRIVQSEANSIEAEQIKESSRHG